MACRVELTQADAQLRGVAGRTRMAGMVAVFIVTTVLQMNYKVTHFTRPVVNAKPRFSVHLACA